MALDILAKLKETRVVPVSVFDNVDDSLRVAEMLMKRNMSFIEVTMRTVEALDCIEAIARRFPEMALGAGSVLDGDMLKQAAGAGAAFAVAPGLDSEVLSLARYMNMPFVPGITTPSELMAAMKFGSIIKVFPAAVLGGVQYINAITAPFASMELHLMPTGGIDENNYREYLKANRVVACGMSYMVDRKLLRNRDYAAIEKRIDAVRAGLREEGFDR
jgi:2-dehydro-3-deoxyphosphogluconate aldolase/(4S)-4-hydroxy-2-oxoglutarate aldolase